MSERRNQAWLKAGAGRLYLAGSLAGALFLEGWQRHHGLSRSGKCQVYVDTTQRTWVPSLPALGAPVPAHCPLPLDITSREDVWKSLDLRAGFLPRYAHKVYVPGGPQIFRESLLYDSA